jgi:tripartite-type tricarboxylate transporter receptor subunit TctC
MSSMRAQHAREVSSGALAVWIVFDHHRVPDFPGIPTIYELVHNADDRLLADLIYGQNALSRPISAPPGLSPPVTAALRTGLAAAMQDTALREEARKLRLDITPMSGDETQARVAAFYKLPAAVVARAKAVIGGR